jgi:isopenicillin N synthase-like dioxygenase
MIPVIDLKPLFQDSDGLQHVAAQLADVYSTVGFAQVINHQIPPQLIRDLYRASREFHALPEPEKIKLRFKKNLRGYIPLNASTLVKSELGQAKTPNQSESFMILSDIPKDHSWYSSTLGGEQIWPQQLPEFRRQVMAYYSALKSLSHQLMRAFAVALRVPADGLAPYFRNPHILFRLLRYPPVPEHAGADQYGSAPHTDYGCLTLLHQDDSGGLQVQSPEADEWMDVKPLDEALVLNTGQMMSIWSNGWLKATRHRVINQAKGYRFSMPFFYNCDIDAPIAPLPSCVSIDNPARYEPVIYGENLEKFLVANYRFI